MAAFCIASTGHGCTYNSGMRTAHPLLPLFRPLTALLLLGLVTVQTIWAQTTAPVSPIAAASAPATGRTAIRSAQLGQTLRTEDAGAAIEEVRLGGETQTIVVYPKGGMPRYEVLPASGSSGGGTRVWKVLGF
jgi:hypothetical protein